MKLTGVKQYLKSKEASHPQAIGLLRKGAKKLTGKQLAHPTTFNREIQAVSEVLSGPFWNMNYGKNLVHEKLEEEFAAYVGTRYAVAVNTGGMAIQMALRAFGLKPGDEVVHQVDTCVANAFAVLAAGSTPLFVDINKENFMMSPSSATTEISSHTKVIMPVHIWGNPEDMTWVGDVARQNQLYILEDACLALGAEWEGKRVGSIGDAGVFSLGCLKPIQAGEGGIITTNNEALARELRTIRNWGDMTGEYGIRDQRTLSWNGRVSEIVAAVALEQLRGYHKHFEKHRELVEEFLNHITNIDGFELAVPPTSRIKPAFSQVVLKLDRNKLRVSKTELMNRLQAKGIGCWHANFEPMNTLTFFRNGAWRDWVLRGDINKVEQNYSKSFPNSEDVYQHEGLGIARESFLSADRVKWLIKQFDLALLH